MHVWDVQNNLPLLKKKNDDNQSVKSVKSITNLIYNEIQSTLAICYVDNTITLQSFGVHKFEKTVC